MSVKTLYCCFLVLLLGLPGWGEENVSEHPEWGRFFEKHGVVGTIVVYDLKADHFSVFDEERAGRPMTPASTFKIANTLIALETGVVADEQQVLPWDGVKREINEWNHDHKLRTAIKYSVVPAFQQIARQIGPERMKSYLQKFRYGNQDISGGIDRFWLGSSLQISAFQQIDFLKRLYLMELPASERSVRILKDVLLVEATPAYRLRGKTGLKQGDPGVGWWVGWVERDDNTYFFATNIDIAEPSRKRILVTKDVLKSINALP